MKCSIGCCRLARLNRKPMPKLMESQKEKGEWERCIVIHRSKKISMVWGHRRSHEKIWIKRKGTLELHSYKKKLLWIVLFIYLLHLKLINPTEELKKRAGTSYDLNIIIKYKISND